MAETKQLRRFPKASPFRWIHNTLPAPTTKSRKLSYMRPQPQSYSLPAKVRTVRLANWSAAVPVTDSKDGVQWQSHLSGRPSLFPVDSSSRQAIARMASLIDGYVPPWQPLEPGAEGTPIVRAKSADRSQHATSRHHHRNSKQQHQQKRPRSALQKQRERTKVVRQRLESEVLNLVACDFLDKSSTAEHRRMLTAARDAVLSSVVQAAEPTVPPTLAATRAILEVKRKALEDQNPHKGVADVKLIDIRTHKKVFRSYNPFEAQWLDLWGSQAGEFSAGNAHCVRALYKWEELKQKGRAATNASRAAKVKAHQRRLQHSASCRNGRSGHRGSIDTLVAQTQALLRAPLPSRKELKVR